MSGFRLKLDPITCDGHGVCAELFPEQIALDDWGYPIIDRVAIPRQLMAHARRAIEACPVLALSLERVPDPRPAGPVTRRRPHEPQ
jgi:ferredoxin